MAHPDLVKIAREIFDKYMPAPNQLHVRREEVQVLQRDLLNTRIPGSKITERGIALNVSIALQYMEAWLRGAGCVPIHHLMEDAATAEISRSQLWQWVRHRVKTTDGGKVITPQVVKRAIDDEIASLQKQLGQQKFNQSKFMLAKEYLWKTSQGTDYADFLTTLMYDSIVDLKSSSSKL